METAEDIIEKDEDLKATEVRIVELRQKKDRTTDEEEEFKKLKQHHRGRVEEQITSERERAQIQAERAAKAEQALEDARQRLKDLEESRNSRIENSNGSENESVMINGKKFYTDEAISIRVQKGIMTQSEGWKMQREAIKEEAKAELKGEEPRNEAARKRQESLEFVKKEGYGWMLDEKDPKHNPNDPLFKEANRLWFNGYQYHPDGPRLALEDAKKNLGTGVKRNDLSDDFSVPRNNSSSDSSSQKSKKVDLSDIEQSNAIRYYVHGNVNNPKTGRPYTETEALSKALEAKRKRLVK